MALIPLMTFAQRGKGESHQRTSKCLKEDVRPMLLHWANVPRTMLLWTDPEQLLWHAICDI
jgi:hypothetical protein